jgi:hypothetical protein
MLQSGISVFAVNFFGSIDEGNIAYFQKILYNYIVLFIFNLIILCNLPQDFTLIFL